MKDLFSEKTNYHENRWTFIPGIFLSEESLEESNILNSKELLIFILESIQDGVSILDTEMNIKYVNNSIKYWYKESNKILGEKCYQIYHNRELPCEICPVKRTMKTRSAELDTVPYNSQSGENGWQELFSIPIFNNKNEIIAVLEYVRDITLQRYIEDRLQSLLDRMDNIEGRNELLTNLLRQRETEKQDLENTITKNMEKFIKPSLEHLKKFTDEKNVEFVESLIEEIIQPVTKKRNSIIGRLTSRELQITEMIKDGKTSKEIAEKLCVTKKAVDFHRTNIRKKLGINGKKVNLRTYLLSHN
jgi:DNA-binding CsgD family transcriptional regulator